MDGIVINHLLTRIDSEDSATPTGATVVAMCGPALVATLHLGMWEPVAFVRSFWVEPEYRSHGVGYRMLHVAESIARKAQCTGIALNVANANARAVAFYKRQGLSRERFASFSETRYSKTF